MTERVDEIKKGVSSDVGRARIEQGDWKIFTAHFRTSGSQVPYIRILNGNGRNYVVAVLDAEERKGEIVAACEFRLGRYGPFFMTTPEHIGHFDLCCHLLSTGVRGRYTDYLDKIEQGMKRTAKEESGNATILFSVQLTEETLEDWDIEWGEYSTRKTLK